MKNEIRNEIRSVWAALVLSGAAVACAAPVQDSQQQRTLDGVKLIAAGVEDREDPATFSQSQYMISPDHRLLLRYETLEKEATDVRTEDGHKVTLLIAPALGEDLASAQKNFKVCPLKRNWMMAATWRRAHPFNKEGYWAAGGGDYDSLECIQSTTTSGGFAVFDVTPWFLNYVRGRKQNFGLLLISDVKVQIAGDNSGSSSPRIQWVNSQAYPIPTASSAPGSASFAKY